MSCRVPHCFITLFIGFHTIFHSHFVPWLSRTVFAQSDSPPVWLLTFPVKEPYCWLLIPLHPFPHKTILSIASTEYIHRLVSQSGRHHHKPDNQIKQSCPLIVYRLLFRTLCLRFPHSIKSLIMTRIINAQIRSRVFFFLRRQPCRIVTSPCAFFPSFLPKILP